MRDAPRARRRASGFGAALFALATLFSCERAACAQGPLTAATATEAQPAATPALHGRLEARAGATVLFVDGDATQRGFAEGYLLADELLECFDEFALGHVVAGRAPLWDLLVLPTVRAKFEFEADTRAWSEAIVAGARSARSARGTDLHLARIGRELTGEDVLACAAIPDLAGLLCSSFAAWDSATATGDVLVGRNLDYPSTPAVERHSLLRVQAAYGERAGWIGVGWPGSPGCLTGLSDRGVFVAIHDVVAPSARSRERATPRVLALQELIETARPGETCVAEALASLRRRKFVMGGNVMLAWQGADARGAAVLELDGRHAVDGGVTARYPALGEPLVACSNHHRLRATDGHACGRFRALMEGADGPPLTRASAWALIDSSGMRITLYRCVADLGARTLEVRRRTDEGWQPLVSQSHGAASESR